MRIPFISILAAGTLALGGCAYGDYGYGAGYGGYGSYYGDYGYGTPYSGYGYGYGGYDPFGWYGDYYYPGVGIYVFDRNRHRHVWNGDQQRYWSGRGLNGRAIPAGPRRTRTGAASIIATATAATTTAIINLPGGAGSERSR
jgi:hypothetical protein